ncbi:MAG: homoserine O-acetyltransferase/O-succinyltransferase family protein [Rhizomicrobium sp.]
MAVVAAPRRGGRETGSSEFCIELGLVNNMPDAALERTERQFFHLLGAAARNLLVRVSFFSLSGLVRDTAGRDHLERNSYRGSSTIESAGLDALIVTGTEPHAPDLRLEPYWSELAALFDWIAGDGPSTVFSCLAAHAAVFRYDGIERQPLTEKRFGVFEHVVAGHDVLTGNLPQPVHVVHSRWNEVGESALACSGYRILTWAPEAGVDMFLRRGRNDLLFCQGHPEYDPANPVREYHRDVRRFLAGERDAFPTFPRNYFSPAETLALEHFRERAIRARDASLLAEFPAIRRRPEVRWQPPAAPVFQAWLRQIVETKRHRRSRARQVVADSFLAQAS